MRGRRDEAEQQEMYVYIDINVLRKIVLCILMIYLKGEQQPGD